MREFERMSEGRQSERRDELGDFTESLFVRNVAALHRMIAGRELMVADCDAYGGCNTLWPMRFGKGIAIAEGPKGDTLTFSLEGREGGLDLCLRDAAPAFVPLCLWEETLVPGDWSPVTSHQFRLPAQWLGRQDVAQLALGGGKRGSLGAAESVRAEMGFVANSSLADGQRHFELRVFGRTKFAGDAIVEVQFLDRNGEVLSPEDYSGRVKPAIRPQLVEFVPFTGVADTARERRVVEALGGDLVEANCRWRIPGKLHHVRSCRIVVRPLTPDEAVLLAPKAEPIPFLGDDKSGYTARRRRSGIALGDAPRASKHGFLLGVVDREQLLKRIGESIQSADWQLTDHRQDVDAAQSDAVAAAVETMERGSDTLLLAEGVSNEDLLPYIAKMYWNGVADARRRRARSKVKVLNEADCGEDFSIAATVAAGSSEESSSLEDYRRWSRTAPMMELLAEIGIETFDKLIAVACQRIETCTQSGSWHRDLGVLMIEEGLTIRELAEQFGREPKAVSIAIRRLIQRLLNTP